MELVYRLLARAMIELGPFFICFIIAFSIRSEWPRSCAGLDREWLLL